MARRLMRGSGSTLRGVIFLFGAAVHEWEPVKLAGGILIFGAGVHKGEPGDFVGGVHLFGHVLENMTINLWVNR